MSLEALFKGWTGELKTKITQGLLLDSQKYHVFNNILIKTAFGSTQIDHIVVSKFSIFVIETKQRDGWIFGSEKEEKWTQVIFKKKVRFQNPLLQNYGHTKSLAEFLSVDHDKIHSVVVFWGNCKFKTQMPENVIKSFTGCTSYIKSRKQVVFTDEEVNKICNTLKELKDSTTFMNGWRHTQSLRNRYDRANICPKCGGNLVERIALKGEKAGTKFIGCDNYPQCFYKRAQ